MTMFDLKYTHYILPLLLSALLLLALVIMSWRQRHHTAGRAFLVMVVALFVWTVGFALEITAVTLNGKIFWANVQFLGIVVIPFAWLTIVLAYTGRSQWLSKTIPFLIIWALISLLLIRTNDRHHLFRQTPYIDVDAGPFPVLVNDYGPWFYWGHAPVGYVIYVVTYSLLIYTYVKSATAYRRQILLLLLVFSLPMLVDVLYIVGVTPIPNFNFTTVVFSVVAIVLSWLLFRYRFLDLMPVARSTLVNMLDDAWIVLDHADRFVDLNPAAQAFFDQPPDALVGQPIAAVMTRQPGSDWVARFHANRRWEDEIERRGRFYNVRLTPLYDKNGRLSGRLILIRDITTRKEAENAIKKLSRVVEQTDDAVFITDINGAIEYVNPAFVAQTGYTSAEAIGQTPRLLKSGRHTPVFYQTFWQGILSGESYKGIFQNKKKDGTIRFEEKTITPIRNTHNEITHFVSTGRDITGRIQVELALREAMQAAETAKQELEAQNVELDAFAHTAAHDLKGPLSVLSGFAELLYDSRLSETQRLRAAQVIWETSAKMASIVDELLLLSSVRKEDVILRQAVLMEKVMPQALKRIAWMKERYAGEIVLPESWPAVLGYAGWIEEVWVNYLSNGLKYGGQPPRLICGYDHQDDQMIRFWVKDNGTGISPEKQAELYAEFTRLEQTRASGHGLGLSIVKRIVEKLGGEVGLESAPGEGSTFYFTLPVY